jgi:hypothetical protein
MLERSIPRYRLDVLCKHDDFAGPPGVVIGH